MANEENRIKNSNLLMLYSETVLWGVIRGVLSLPFEHPFDRIKTTMQLYPNKRSKEVISEIKCLYNPNGSHQGIKGLGYGIRGFYSGAIPNTIRAASKNAYRWPLQFALPNFYSNLFGDEIERNYPGLKKLVTGLTIASLEAFIISPLERVKVWFMSVEKSKATFKNFMAQPHLFSEYYRGIWAVLPKQIISWTTYSYSDYKLREYAHTLTNKKQLGFLDLLLVSIGVALINTAAVMPFDAVKTRAQAANAIRVNNFGEVLKLICNIHKEAGIRGFYAGTRWKLVQYFINSCFTVTAMDYFENRFKEHVRLDSPPVNPALAQAGIFANRKVTEKIIEETSPETSVTSGNKKGIQ